MKSRRQRCVVQVNAAVHIPLRLLDDAEGACCRAWQPRGSSRSQHAEQRAQRCRRRGRRRGSGCRRIGSSGCCRREGRGCRRRGIQWHPRSQTLNHYIVEILEGAGALLGQQQCLQQLRPDAAWGARKGAVLDRHSTNWRLLKSCGLHVGTLVFCPCACVCRPSVLLWLVVYILSGLDDHLMCSHVASSERYVMLLHSNLDAALLLRLAASIRTIQPIHTLHKALSCQRGAELLCKPHQLSKASMRR